MTPPGRIPATSAMPITSTATTSRQPPSGITTTPSGMTRSNVYAGPAGFWLIRGGPFDHPTVAGSGADAVLPGPAPVAGQGVLDLNVPGNAVRNMIREIPIAIQDRSFNADGSLFYPENRAFFEGLEPRQLKIPFIPNRRSDISPIWNPEAFFNVMVVNGVTWPQLEVAPALYRFRFLNGCNSRFLWLKFNDPAVEVWQIGAEQGFLPAPVLMNSLGSRRERRRHRPVAHGPGRAGGRHRGLQRLGRRRPRSTLLNIGPDEPFGGGIPGVDFDPADPGTTGKVMKFVVNDGPCSARAPPTPAARRPPRIRSLLVLNAEGALGAADESRDVSLNEEVSEKMCATALPNGTIRWIASVKPGPGLRGRLPGRRRGVLRTRGGLLGTVDTYRGDPVASR